MRELRSVGAIVTIKWCGITVTQKSQITNISNYAKLHQLFAEVGEGVEVEVLVVLGVGRHSGLLGVQQILIS